MVRNSRGYAIPLNPPGSRSSDHCRVLVVDDDLATVETMAAVIKACGHEVRCAINGVAAIDVAKHFWPDVVVLDVHLPDVSGDKVARLLKLEPGLENVRVIAISGDDRMRAPALRAGCTEFHAKPISLQLLESFLHK
jgi:CheY-like chemotaxis protein